MSMAPRIVIFDIGNVLLQWDMRNLFARIIPGEENLEGFLRDVCTMQWHGTLDAGATFAQAISSLSEAFPQRADVIAAYDPRWQETIGGPIEGSVAILARLRAAGVRTYAITNFPAEKFDETCALYPFLCDFEGVIVSGRERLVKPDPAIFELFLARFGLDAAQCVFIDDNPANVDAASVVGMTALRFRSPERLARELQDLGFPV